MMNYLFNNKEWIFSGIGVFILTLLLTIRKRKRAASKNSITKSQSIQNPALQDSVMTNIMAEHVEFHQTVHQKESGENNGDQKDQLGIKVDGYPDLEKAKIQYLKKQETTSSRYIPGHH